MSFGKNKMHAVCDELAPQVLISDHRGMEWLVITASSIYCGKVEIDGPGNETLATSVAGLPDAFKPWARKLLKNLSEKEARNVQQA